ncbi:hypothetical protein [Echinicola vietnamensis]|uniref:Uncharacterized protein n=1 Tax=Echinicola vietnamensis (strain DSM 17526 / LMG 23754 / KMM 6221) TaxID=926556 RepID=L0G3N2_ECHVK|nr:hypothetical protein [Echinicola vietnamensis]AGA79923.1 hypothetical protein Echvi_3711 [Echinicola vietnamensis DSM 17526]
MLAQVYGIEILNKKMEQNKLKALSNEELLKEAKKLKSSKTIDATLIGFLVGILIYSIFVGNFSYFLGLILLYAIFKLISKNKYKKEEIENILKERNIK